MSYSSDVVADAVRGYWKTCYPRTVIAFFYQKYEYDSEWEWCEELVECNASDDYETVIFQSDFCEGQTCVKDISIVPLEDIVDYYIKNLPSAQPFDKDTNVPNTDTISRQAAIGLLEVALGDDWEVDYAVDRMNELPSAQPDIIACGDCKHWICHDRRCGYWNHGVKPLEWCCHAERRTDGKD